MDIRMSKASDNLVSVRKAKGGGHITLGVDEGTCRDIMNFALGINTHNAVLLVFNMAQFDQIRKELSKESGDAKE